MKAQGEIEGVGEEVVADAGGESLAHRLHVEALHALQPQAHQHGNQQQQHQGAQLGAHRHPLQPGQHRLVAQGGDGLPHQQRLHGSGTRHRDQQHQGEQQAAAVAAQIRKQPQQPLAITRRHQAGEAAASADAGTWLAAVAGLALTAAI